MTDKASNNPLFEIQREKSGSITFEKYSYQYHWALHKAISELNIKCEYAVIVELHEDVIILDSLDALKAKFELNQVKTNKAKFNTYQLVKNKKNGKSVLGKLIQSSIDKKFTSQVKSLNLISQKEFELELKNKGLSLNSINKNDLSNKQIEDLSKELNKEIGINDLPENLNFIKSTLPEIGFQTFLIGNISEKIAEVFPDSNSNSKEIYGILIHVSTP